MIDLIIIAAVIVITALAALYVYKSKKSGSKCIGCPNSASCTASKNSCSCSCGNKEE